MLSIQELKKIGTLCEIDGEPYEVIWTQHVQMGRGGAILRLKLKNLINGAALEKTVKGNDGLPEADISRRQVNFLYSDGEGFHFMDGENYDQFTLSPEQVAEKSKYLIDGSRVQILLFNEQPITLQLPVKMEFAVTEAPDGVKGDTAQGKVLKKATIETGAVISVPMFVKIGDTIRVNTETGEYVERV